MELKRLSEHIWYMPHEEEKQYSDIIELLEECIRFRERKK